MLCVSCQTDKKSHQQHSQNKPLIDSLIHQEDSLNIESFLSSESPEVSDSTSDLQDSIIVERNIEKVETKPIPVKEKVKPKARIEFENEFIDFGDIVEGDIIKQKFHFKNVGNAPLEIISAKGTCGCTLPSYPFVEIPPGESGFIGVDYNSVGKWGDQKVNIRISTNARKSDYILYLKGRVHTKDESNESQEDTLSGYEQSKQIDQ